MTSKTFEEFMSEINSTNIEEALANAEKCLEAFEVRDIIKQQQETINRQQAEIKRLTKEKDKAWELFKKKCDEDIELQGLCDKRRIENEKLHVGTVEKTRALFQAMVNKFMSIKDLYVIVDGEYLPWEPAEEVEHLFGMSISGDNDEIDKETDRVIKELVGDEE